MDSNIESAIKVIEAIRVQLAIQEEQYKVELENAYKEVYKLLKNAYKEAYKLLNDEMCQQRIENGELDENGKKIIHRKMSDPWEVPW